MKGEMVGLYWDNFKLWKANIVEALIAVVHINLG
jgi:hypothetical protein